MHIPNEGQRSIGEAMIVKALGLQRGASDLFLAYPTTLYPGYWIELKAPGKKPTETQQEWLDKMRRVGYKTGWFDNARQAIQSIVDYLG